MPARRSPARGWRRAAALTARRQRRGRASMADDGHVFTVQGPGGVLCNCGRYREDGVHVDPPPSPGYYDGKTGMQPFDVIDEFGLDFYEGNVVKYIVRWRKKNGLDDLRKARTYLNRIIARVEGQ